MMDLLANLIESVQRERSLDFPDYLLLLRQARKVSRRCVKEGTGISMQRIRCLEIGQFQSVKLYERESLARYYNISAESLLELEQRYIGEKKFSRRVHKKSS